MSIVDVLCSLITGGEVGVVVGEELQVGVQLVDELFGQGLESIYPVLFLIAFLRRWRGAGWDD